MVVLGPAPAPTVDPSQPNTLRWDDIGLVLTLDFITEEEETAMIKAFHAQDVPGRDSKSEAKAAKRRRVSRHFGYHFDYTTFGASETHFTPVPSYISSLLPRLPIQSYLPDQFTVQYYPPGSGIPPHVDTHSMFGEALYSLSFGSAVPMQFRMSGPNDARKMRLPKRSLQPDGGAAPSHNQPGEGERDDDHHHHHEGKKGWEQQQKQQKDKEGEQEEEEEEQEPPAWELLLPARSLLLMTGPSRYGYTHAIRARKTDIIDGRTVPRRDRYSITMRTVRRGSEVGCDCAYPGVCDARIREEMARQGEAQERRKYE
ncbi:hypothetical protein L209DRAFT_676278 [Thermothelomyces heterothallicus CBS 203.75]